MKRSGMIAIGYFVKSTSLILSRDDLDLEQVIPITIHGDGAQFYPDDEHLVYSFCSTVGNKSDVSMICLKDTQSTCIPVSFTRNKALTQKASHASVADVTWRTKKDNVKYVVACLVTA